MNDRGETQFAIIGAGAGGICAGVRLSETGREDFLIFDREPSVGGTWLRNTYPGACCDIASHMYSYSFAPSAEWSKPYGTQPEILEYLQRVAADRGLGPHLRLNTGVKAAVWDPAAARWTLTLDDGNEVNAERDLVNQLKSMNVTYQTRAVLRNFNQPGLCRTIT